MIPTRTTIQRDGMRTDRWSRYVSRPNTYAKLNFFFNPPPKTNDEKEPCTLNQIACLCVPSILILNFVDNLTSSAECSKNWNKKRSNKKTQKRNNKSRNHNYVSPTAPLLLQLSRFREKNSPTPPYGLNPVKKTWYRKSTYNWAVIFSLFLFVTLNQSQTHTHTQKTKPNSKNYVQTYIKIYIYLYIKSKRSTPHHHFFFFQLR